jgi:transcriptional regulator with XRE-family HTH domain
MENILGHRLAMLRHGRRLSQHTLSTQVAITQKHLSQIEQGRQSLLSVASGTVLRLAQSLGVSTDYLLGLSNNEEGCR